MSVRPQIEDPTGVSDPKAVSVFRSIKAILDAITGRRQGQQIITQLAASANINGIISKVNEVIRRLHSIPEPVQQPTAASATKIEDLVVERNIRLDVSNPSYGWRDIIGQIISRNIGATAPNYTAWNGAIDQYQFAVGDEVDITYHIPHDWVPGTDLFIHWHWSLASAGVSENVTWGCTASVAKGFNQAAFNAPITVTALQASSTTALQHMIIETQLSSVGGSGGTLLDTSTIEVDSILNVQIYLSANSGATDPFLHTADIHYQSSNMATKQKAPDFYV